MRFLDSKSVHVAKCCGAFTGNESYKIKKLLQNLCSIRFCLTKTFQESRMLNFVFPFIVPLFLKEESFDLFIIPLSQWHTKRILSYSLSNKCKLLFENRYENFWTNRWKALRLYALYRGLLSVIVRTVLQENNNLKHRSRRCS